MLRSQLCSAESLRSPALLAWAERLRPMWAAADEQREVMLHRKMWEWLFIAEALRERDMLTAGCTGLGFGVGREPLVALFADAGCDIVATDQPHESAVATGWTDSAVEWAGGLEDLNEFGLCATDDFVQRVAYRPLDMTAVPADLTGFDFAWSSCALEHLGTLGAGMDFVDASLTCLRPGGVAVHTTEYLVSSNDATVEAGGTVFYRRRDIEELVARLGRAGHEVDMDYTLGATPEDEHVDVPPYSDVHLRTELAGHVTTSLALIVTKGSGRGRRRLFRRGRGSTASPA